MGCDYTKEENFMLYGPILSQLALAVWAQALSESCYKAYSGGLVTRSHQPVTATRRPVSIRAGSLSG